MHHTKEKGNTKRFFSNNHFRVEERKPRGVLQVVLLQTSAAACVLHQDMGQILKPAGENVLEIGISRKVSGP